MVGEIARLGAGIGPGQQQQRGGREEGGEQDERHTGRRRQVGTAEQRPRREQQRRRRSDSGRRRSRSARATSAWLAHQDDVDRIADRRGEDRDAAEQRLARRDRPAPGRRRSPPPRRRRPARRRWCGGPIVSPRKTAARNKRDQRGDEGQRDRLRQRHARQPPEEQQRHHRGQRAAKQVDPHGRRATASSGGTANRAPAIATPDSIRHSIVG